jgi:hypothetical protein
MSIVFPAKLKTNLEHFVSFLHLPAESAKNRHTLRLSCLIGDNIHGDTGATPMTLSVSLSLDSSSKGYRKDVCFARFNRAGRPRALHPCVTFGPVCGTQSRLFAVARAPLTAAPFLARFFCPRQRSQAKPSKVTKSGWGPSPQGRSAPRPCARTFLFLLASAGAVLSSLGLSMCH